MHSSLKQELHPAPPCLHPPACLTLACGPTAAPASVSATELASPSHASADRGTARALHFAWGKRDQGTNVTRMLMAPDPQHADGSSGSPGAAAEGGKRTPTHRRQLLAPNPLLFPPD